jgi:hypothetical protein
VLVRAFALLSCLLLVGACAGETGSGDTPEQETALEGLTPERLCELLPDDTIEQTLDVVVKKAGGRQSGRPPILSKTCRYSLEFSLQEVETLPPAVTTNLKQTGDKSVDEVLERAFTDLVDENKPVTPFERVEGLGEGAGYGDAPLLAGQELPESQLVVVFTAGDEQLSFDVTVTPKTPLEKLTPLAEDLLTALETELR